MSPVLSRAARSDSLQLKTVRRCLVTDRPLVTSHLEAAVADRRAGAVVCFVGTVRDHDDGAPVTALCYEAHPDAERMLSGLLAGFVATHPDVIALAVAHRHGHLDIGDVACVVAVSAAHRAPAFAACAELLELVKSEAAVWKHQTYADGTSQWVGMPGVTVEPDPREGLASRRSAPAAP